MDRDKGDPLYINTRAMLDNKVGMEAVGLAMDLIMLAWWPTKTPFAWNEAQLLELLNGSLPARGYTADILRRNSESARSFFTVLPDGRWTPSPHFFSMVDGNPGSQS